MRPCPKCGVPNAPDRATCVVCGLALAPQPEPQPEIPAGDEPIGPPPKTQAGLAPLPKSTTERLDPVQIPPAPKTVPGIAQEPPKPEVSAKAFKQTMIGLAPGSYELPKGPAPAAPPAPMTTAANPVQTLGMPQPASPKAPPAFQTLLGVAPEVALPVEPKNEAQQTLLGAGEFSNPVAVERLPMGSNKGTLIGVAIPGVAPVNPGIEKQIPAEPAPPPPATPTEPELSEVVPQRTASRNYLALALMLTAVVLAVISVLALWWWRATPRLTVQVRTDESGNDSLELECGNCNDGSKIALLATVAEFRDHHATLPLKQPLRMGDNLVALILRRPGTREESIQLKVPVDFRVRGDTSGIESATPKLRLFVEKSSGVTFEVEGKPLAFDAAGHGQFELDVTPDVSGQASTEQALRKRLSYVAKTPSGEVRGAVSMQVGVIPLIIEAPGPLLVTSRNEFRLCGYTAAGGQVDVAGLKIEVDKAGRFCHPMLIREYGKFTIWVTATAKGEAPRKVSRVIERNADLASYAKKLYQELDHGLITPDSNSSNPLQVALVGNVLEVSDNGSITRLLLRLDPKSGATGMVRVVATNQFRVAAGQQLTVFGQISGTLKGPDGRDMSEISAAFLVPGIP